MLTLFSRNGSKNNSANFCGSCTWQDDSLSLSLCGFWFCFYNWFINFNSEREVEIWAKFERFQIERIKLTAHAKLLLPANCGRQDVSSAEPIWGALPVERLVLFLSLFVILILVINETNSSKIMPTVRFSSQKIRRVFFFFSLFLFGNLSGSYVIFHACIKTQVFCFPDSHQWTFKIHHVLHQGTAFCTQSVVFTDGTNKSGLGTTQ